MVHTRIHRRLAILLALGLMTAGGLVLAQPAEAQQSRYRVFIPEPQGDGPRNFGRNIARELQKLIDEMPTHRSVERNEMRDALRQYDMRERDLTCISAQQLAAVAGFELVMCGEYGPTEGGTEVRASFVSPREQINFEVPAITTQDAKEAARHIYDSFQGYVQLVSYTQYCNQDLANEQWSEALRRCEQALEIEPTTMSALYGRGFALMKLEQHEAALEALEQLLEMDPFHSDALMAAGFVAARMDQKDRSRDFYNRYLELNPGDAQVRLTVAIDAAGAGDPEGALQIAEAGMDTDEPDLTLLEYAGYFAMSAGSRINQEAAGQGGANSGPTPEAAAYYEKALGYFEPVFEEKGEEVATNLVVQMLNAYNQLGRTERALEFGAEAVQIKPESPEVWSTYAQALSRAGRIDDALAALDTVLVLDPEARNIRARQGQLLLQEEDIARARQAFIAAVERNEITADQAATSFLAVGVNEKIQKDRFEEAMPYMEAVRDLAESPRLIGQANYFAGYILLMRGRDMQEPGTTESARASLPVFQEALRLFEQSRDFQSGNLDQLIDNAQRYIEIQEALIRRGGGR